MQFMIMQHYFITMMLADLIFNITNWLFMHGDRQVHYDDCNFIKMVLANLVLVVDNFGVVVVIPHCR
jgi:hypothetical protein